MLHFLSFSNFEGKSHSTIFGEKIFIKTETRNHSKHLWTSSDVFRYVGSALGGWGGGYSYMWAINNIDMCCGIE